MTQLSDESSAKAAIVRLARALLLGELSVIEAAPQIEGVARASERLDRDEDVVAFRGIASETDVHLIGDREQGWHPEVREQRLAERAAAEAFYRERALRAAESLVTKFGSQGK